MTVNNKLINLIVSIILLSSIGFFVITILFINKDFSKDFFFDNFHDKFMDFNNSIRDAKDGTVYEVQRVIYPPLITIVYFIFSLFLPKEAVYSSFENRYITWNYNEFLVSYIIFQLISFGILLFFLLKGEKNKFKAILFFLLFVSSMPVIWALERGNSIILSCAFLLGFFLWKDSESRIMREVSLIFLALSTAIKIYPIFFVICLLNEKRFKDFWKTAIYIIVFTFVPFIFYDGYNGISQMASNIFSFQSNSSAKFSFYSTNISAFMDRFNIDVPSFIGYGIMLIYLVIAFFSKRKWITAMMITFFILSFSGSQIKYNATYFFIPILVLMKEEKLEIVELVSLILLILMVIPNGLEIVINGQKTLLSFNILFPFMMILVLISGLFVFLDFKKKKEENKENEIV